MSQAEETAHVQGHRREEQPSLFISRKLFSISCNHEASGGRGQAWRAVRTATGPRSFDCPVKKFGLFLKAEAISEEL